MSTPGGGATAGGAGARHPLLVPDRRLRRRKLVNRTMEATATLAALVAVAVLALVIASVLIKGVSAINLDFLTKEPAPFGQSGGGIANSIVGTVLLVAMASALAVPVGILIGIHTSEFARPSVASSIRFALDILNGVPTIVTGIFVFGLLVVGHVQSGYAGAVALAIIMLPIVARSAHEVLALVPSSLREASLALGVPRWRTVLTVIVPTAVSGLITGALLAVARVAGETAPLLFTSSIASTMVSTDPSKALSSIPVRIFELSESPSPAEHAQAWAAALLLIVFVMLLNVLARSLFGRSRARIARTR
ncbi:MAG TPA: phosphate ABC transporter permease PstA [Solirubrobacteraceae bacterium]|nr:phosphate ABC transporter permease PstA [Solirubrobacteraceae bacterium]